MLNNHSRNFVKGVERMKKLWNVLVIGVFLLGLATYGYTWGGPMGHGFQGRGPGYGMLLMDLRLIPDLKLTPEQETKIDALRMEHLKEIKPLQDKMFSLNGDLRLLWLERVPDEAKIKSVQKELRSVQDELWDKQTSFLIKLKGLLTPEQQKKLDAYRWLPRRIGIGKRGADRWPGPPYGDPSMGPGPWWR